MYNMKILRSYVDEILENIEFASFELKMGLKSLIFWQGKSDLEESIFPCTPSLHSSAQLTSLNNLI